MRYQTATQWGAYDVEVEDGKIVAVHGHPADPHPAAIGQTLVDGVQHDLRIKRPAIRRAWLERRDKALRGADEFVDVPWDEALELAAGELRRVVDEHGNKSIFGGSYGWASAGRFHHAQSQLHRFINLLGGCTRAMNSYSTAAAQVILPHVVAPWHQMELEQPTWDEISKSTELFVVFGGVPLRNTQVAYGGITEHQTQPGLEASLANGMQVVNISPTKADMPEWAQSSSQWVAARPGTDVALMLGMAFVLESENLVDRGFLNSHCVGYDKFKTYLLGGVDGHAKDPRWASEISGVSVIRNRNTRTPLG